MAGVNCWWTNAALVAERGGTVPRVASGRADGHAGGRRTVAVATSARCPSLMYFHGPPGSGTGRTYHIAPDGKRFLMIKGSGADEPGLQNLVVVQNWSKS